MTIDLTPLVQALLPRRFYGKAKAVVAAILSVAAAVLLVLPYFTDVPEQVGVVVGIVIAVLTPIGVFLTGNADAASPAHHDGDEPGATSVQDVVDRNRYGTA